MTAKFAAAGLARGGGKTVVAMPEDYDLTPDRKRAILHDVGDAIEAQEGRYATGTLRGLRLAVAGLGNVGARIAALLSEAGAELVLSDIDPAKRAVADRLGAAWQDDPHEALTADVDIVVPATLGGVLTSQIVPELRCRAMPPKQPPQRKLRAGGRADQAPEPQLAAPALPRLSPAARNSPPRRPGPP